MADNTHDDDSYAADQHITAHSRYYAGKMGSAFYRALRDDCRIFGVRCEKCRQVFWPPRSTCGRCFSLLPEDALVEIGPCGTLMAFTKVHYHETIHPRQAPFVYGIVQMEGADTGMVHFIDGGGETLQIGMRVCAVFAEKRNGNILDIVCFRPD
jgi:uncharacterized OB-fold protein